MEPARYSSTTSPIKKEASAKEVHTSRAERSPTNEPYVVEKAPESETGKAKSLSNMKYVDPEEFERRSR
jgi:tetratricopeptide (TPR) repeat protein